MAIGSAMVDDATAVVVVGTTSVAGEDSAEESDTYDAVDDCDSVVTATDDTSGA